MTRGDISPSIGTRTAFPPLPTRGRRVPARRPHRQRQATATVSSSQTIIFRMAAPPLIFAVLVAGLLVELRMHLAPPPPLPVALPGLTVRGNTVAQSALLWAEARWPGMWAFPVLCAGALAALRAAIWAGAAVVDGFARGAGADGVRVGRWEDGGSVSGGDLLTGVFT